MVLYIIPVLWCSTIAERSICSRDCIWVAQALSDEIIMVWSKINLTQTR